MVPQGERDADEQANETANDDVETITRHDPLQSLADFVHQTHGGFPAEHDGNACHYDQTSHIDKLFHHNRAERLGRHLRVTAPHEQRASEFTEPRSETVDKI